MQPIVSSTSTDKPHPQALAHMEGGGEEREPGTH